LFFIINFCPIFKLNPTTFPLSRESGNEIRKSARDIMSSILSFWDSCRVSFSKNRGDLVEKIGMRGSVGELMKKKIFVPINWIIRNKFLKKRHTERLIESFIHSETRVVKRTGVENKIASIGN